MIKRLFIKSILLLSLCIALIPTTTIQAKINSTRTTKGYFYINKDTSQYIIDDSGEMWIVEDVKGITNDTRVKVKFNTMGTKSIYDDEILSISILSISIRSISILSISYTKTIELN